MFRETTRALHTQQVFLSITNKPIPIGQRMFRRPGRNHLKTGIEGACFHDLRHDFMTRAMRSGNASHVVMKQVGHKTDSMLRRYLLVNERDLREPQID